MKLRDLNLLNYFFEPEILQAHKFKNSLIGLILKLIIQVTKVSMDKRGINIPSFDHLTVGFVQQCFINHPPKLSFNKPLSFVQKSIGFFITFEGDN